MEETLGGIFEKTPVPDELYETKVGQLIYGNDTKYMKESIYYKKQADVIERLYKAFYGHSIESPEEVTQRSELFRLLRRKEI